LAQGFPLRGAITYGDLYIYRKSHVFLGEAMINAYEKEQNQDWIGALVDSSFWNFHEDLQTAISTPMSLLGILFPEYDVPMKLGKSAKSRVINWRFNLVVKNGTRSLFPNINQDDVIRKQNNTLEFALWVRKSKLAYISNVPPIEVRTFYIGDSSQKPPFDHGDEL
jgi:hypothetical protein